MSGIASLAPVTKWEGPRLTGGSNFTEWQQYILAVSVTAEVHYLIADVDAPNSSAVSRRRDDPPTDPASMSEEDRRPSVLRTKHKRWLWGLLFNSLAPAVASRLSLAARDPVDHNAVLLWKELHERYDRTRGIRAAQLQHELLTMKLKPNANVEHHFNKMHDLYNRMIISGYKFDDEQLAFAMASSLPTEYSVLTGVILRAPNLTAEMVQEEITSEWIRLGMPGKDDDEKDTAPSDDKGLVAKAKSTKKPKEKKFHCTKHPSSNSHDSKDCYILKREAEEKAEKAKKESKPDRDDGAFDVAAVAMWEMGEEDYVDIFGMVAVDTVGLYARSDPLDDTYVIDSGCTKHMVVSPRGLTDVVRVHNQTVTVGGKGKLEVTHRGQLTLGKLQIKNTLVVPTLGFNLLSVGLFGEEGYSTLFEKDYCSIRDAEGSEIVRVKKTGLYELKASTMSSALVAQAHSADQLLYLHCSLGHLNWNDVYKLARSGKLGEDWTDIVSPTEMNILCEDCIRAKGHRLPSPTSSVRAIKPNEIVHIDLWGPAKVASLGGSRYFLTCYDDWSHRIQLYFLKDKSEALSAFKKYLALVENQCSSSVKRVRSDNGGEFTSKAFVDLLESTGIEANRVPPAAHAQNGRVERVHLTVMNLVRAMLLESGLDKTFWSEAAAYAAFVRNRVPKRGTMDIPQELWSGQKCSLTQLRPFGSLVYVRDHTDPDKLSPRYFSARLMGFRSWSEHTIRYYNPETKKFGYSRDYILERRSQSAPPTILSSELLARPTPAPARLIRAPPFALGDEVTELPDTVVEPVTETPEPIEHVEPAALDTAVTTDPLPPIPPLPKTQGKGVTYELTTEERGTSKFVPGEVSYMDENGRRILPRRNKSMAAVATDLGELEDEAMAVLEIQRPAIGSNGQSMTMDPMAHLLGLLADSEDSTVSWCLLATDCPKTVRQARSSPDWPSWWKAMAEEMAKMDQYDVYEVVDRTDQMRVLRARWVFTRKVDGVTGEAAAFKARWVAKGFTQVQGVDFHEIFASVAHKDTIRTFLAMVNWHRLHCDQVDIKAAFLNGELKETIYMEPPEGLDTPPNKVYRLKKSLYGLRQSPRCFNDELDAWLRSQGFVPSIADPCLYVYLKERVLVMLTVHVDDQLIASNNRSALDIFKRKHNAAFECTDHGPVNYFLGFNVTRDVQRRVLSISQEHYFTHLLERFDMTDAKPAATPLPSDFVAKDVTDQQYDAAKHLPYREIVGSVMYAATISRPDLAFSAGLLARFMTKWSAEHYRAAKHLLRYVKGTIDYALTFDASSCERTLQGYVDADWGGCLTSRHSTSGYGNILFGALVGWKARRQPTVALSTMEAELSAACDATKQAAWLRQILQDLHVPVKGPIRYFCDNQGAIAAAANPGQHDKRKHMGMKAHYVTDEVKKGRVAFDYIPTEDNAADLLTKPLDRFRTAKLARALGIRSRK